MPAIIFKEKSSYNWSCAKVTAVQRMTSKGIERYGDKCWTDCCRSHPEIRGPYSVTHFCVLLKNVRRNVAGHVWQTTWRMYVLTQSTYWCDWTNIWKFQLDTEKRSCTIFIRKDHFFYILLIVHAVSKIPPLSWNFVEPMKMILFNLIFLWMRYRLLWWQSWSNHFSVLWWRWLSWAIWTGFIYNKTKVNLVNLATETRAEQ